MTTFAATVLVIEDDKSIAQSLTASLADANYTVMHAPTGAAALELLSEAISIVLLDLGLPDMDGVDVCRAIRAHTDSAIARVPIIVVTARSEEFDQVLGLELGADDYVVKPFGFRQLNARMRAVLRRVATSPAPSTTPNSTDDQHPAADDIKTVGPLEVDSRTHRATLAGQELELTPKEFALLAYLIEDAGAVRSRTDILEEVWDANWFGPTKTIDAHVAGLRKKLGDHRWIAAVRGVGFRLEQPDD